MNRVRFKMKFELINFDIMGDERGSLIALEEHYNAPFDIKRVYYIFDTKSNVRRGLHSHKKLEQVLICVSGSCKILLDNGKERDIIELKNPSKGLYLNSTIWREMFDFSSDCVLIVLANEYYYESDYIRDYKEFIEYIDTFDDVQWMTSVEVLDFTYDKSQVEIEVDEDERLVVDRQTTDSPYKIAIEYRGAVYGY